MRKFEKRKEIPPLHDTKNIAKGVLKKNPNLNIMILVDLNPRIHHLTNAEKKTSRLLRFLGQN